MSLKSAKRPSVKWHKEYDKLSRKHNRFIKDYKGVSRSLVRTRKERDKYKNDYEQLLNKIGGYINSIPD